MKCVYMLRHRPTGLYFSKSGRIHKLSENGEVYSIPIQMKWYFDNPDSWILIKYKNTDKEWTKVYCRDFEIVCFRLEEIYSEHDEPKVP